MRLIPTSMSLRARLAVLCSAILLGCAMPAGANDSSATLGAGGLRFISQPDVVMEAESLTLTPGLVTVRYVFRNVSRDDVKTLVAFPLPGIGAVDDFNTVILPVKDDPVDFVGMKTLVDGEPVKMQVEQRARALGIDRTEMLVDLGVPITPYLARTRAAIGALDEAKRAELTSLGLLSKAFGGTQPGWKLFTTFYWLQTFPAGQEVIIEHSYRPVVGTTLSPPVGLLVNEPETVAAARKTYCIDDAMMADIDKRIGAEGKPGEYTYFGQELEYILKTGDNWSGPIRKFHLVVEADKPSDFAFFCLDGLQRRSPTRLEMQADSFRPWRNLKVLFLDAHKLEN